MVRIKTYASLWQGINKRSQTRKARFDLVYLVVTFTSIGSNFTDNYTTRYMHIQGSRLQDDAL